MRPELRTRVDASIVELGYVLDGAAKTLKTHQSKTIGVIVPTLEIGGYASAIQAFEKTVAAPVPEDTPDTIFSERKESLFAGLSGPNAVVQHCDDDL